MPEHIDFRNSPTNGFPSPPGAIVSRVVPTAIRDLDNDLLMLRRGMRIKQVVARGAVDPKQTPPPAKHETPPPAPLWAGGAPPKPPGTAAPMPKIDPPPTPHPTPDATTNTTSPITK